MFKRLFDKLVREATEPKGDTMYTIGPDGKPTNAALHEALMEDVDDTEFVRQTHDKLKAAGASEDILALYKVPPKA